MPDGILGHLDQDLVTGLQRVFHLAAAPTNAQGAPVDVSRVQHAVSALSDIDEGGLHRRQDILHAAQVDIANLGRVRLGRDKVLDQEIILQHTNLGDDASAVGTLLIAHHHGALYRFAARQKLRLGDDVLALAALLPQLRTAAALRLDAG